MHIGLMYLFYNHQSKCIDIIVLQSMGNKSNIIHCGSLC